MTDDAERMAAGLVCGAPLFADDLPEPSGVLHAAVAMAPMAHGVLLGLDLAAARSTAGVQAVLSGGALLADMDIAWAGQPVAAVAAETREQARRAARLVEAYIDPRPAVLTIADALATEGYAGPPQRRTRGNAAAALAAAPHRLQGRLTIAAAAPPCPERSSACAIPYADGGWRIYCATDDPAQVQRAAAAALGVPMHVVAVECRRVGGGAYGGQSGGHAAVYACLAAMLARVCRRPVKFHPDRETATRIGGRRHGFSADFTAGFADDGQLLALTVDLTLDGGALPPADPAMTAVTERALDQIFALCGAADVALSGRACRTHTAPNPADLAGAGTAQGLALMARIMAQAAQALGRDPLDLWLRNPPAAAPAAAAALLTQLTEQADYRRRRAAIAAANAIRSDVKRGLTAIPVTVVPPSAAPAATALARILADGSVAVAHGGVENGQDVAGKTTRAVAATLGVDPGLVRITGGATAQTPDAAGGVSPERWSEAARRAAQTLADRLTPFRREHDGFAAAATAARAAGVSLAALGEAPPPGDGATAAVCAAAMIEAEVDADSGVCRILRADLAYDAGGALAPATDRAAATGAFAIGLDWALGEAPAYDADGALIIGDFAVGATPFACIAPRDMRVWPADGLAGEGRLYPSQAINDAALALGLTGWLAAQAAVTNDTALAVGGGMLDIPATPERLLLALEGAPEED